MRRTLLVTSIAALVVLAGCSSVLGPAGSPTPSPTPTDSPTPTPTPTPPPKPVDAFPGFEGETLQNSSELLSSQSTALNETGFVATGGFDAEITSNETDLTISSHFSVRSEADAAEWFVVSRSENSIFESNETSEVWSNGTLTLERTEGTSMLSNESEVEYGRSNDVAGPGIVGSESSITFVFLNLSEGVLDVSGQTTEGGVRTVTLTADDVNRTRFEAQVGENVTVESFHLEATVDQEGRIHSLEGEMVYSSTSSFGNAKIRLQTDYELQQVGDVEVERPTWFDEAMEQITYFDVSVSVQDGKYVAVTNEGPDAVPAETVLLIDGTESSGYARLEEPIESGETVYVYLRPGGYSGEIARESPTADAQTLSGSYTLEFRKDFSTVMLSVEFTAGEDD